MEDDSGMPVIVTGGCGFIGSHLVRALVCAGHRVLNIDKLSEVADPRNLADLDGDARYEFLRADVCDELAMRAAFERWRPERVFHLAAESHVDRSIVEPGDFIASNILGTVCLLRAARACWCGAGTALADDGAGPMFIQFSTDEVYGSLAAAAPGFTEASPYAPNSPYSASKAAADHLARAWAATYGLPVVLAHATNAHGTHQHPEKLIPRVITRAIRGHDIPVFGDGRQRREWLHVDDLCDALLRISRAGMPGEVFHISAGDEWENLTLVRRILREIDAAGFNDGNSGRLIHHVEDRPGHDFRYALAGTAWFERLGWQPTRGIEATLGDTVRWYLDHPEWWDGKE